MSKQASNTLTKAERTQLLADFAEIWPEAKLGNASNEDLLWLVLIAGHLQAAPRDMSSTLNRYRETYEDTAAYSGRLSKHNGDDVAKLLAGATPEAVIAAAEVLLGLEVGELETRYANLNPGQRRMNAGNRIRACIKRGDKTADELAAAIH